MKERIEKYLRKKRREKAWKMLKDNIFVVLAAFGILIALIVLKVLKKKAKKKVKAKIKESIKNGIDSAINKDYSDLDSQEVGRFIPKDKTASYLTDSLTGILKGSYDYDDAREEALKEKYEITD